MTFRDVYIGELGADGALDWGGSFAIGNTAKRMGPFWHPGAGAKTEPWSLLIDKIEAEELAGQRVDWGAYAARVTVDEIRQFMRDCYGDDAPADIAEFVDALDPDRQYALVASEL